MSVLPRLLLAAVCAAGTAFTIPAIPAQSAPVAPPLPTAPSSAGKISGTIVDATGALISGATVILQTGSVHRTTTSLSDGTFDFEDVVAGEFTVTAAIAGFSPETILGTLSPGEADYLPPISLKMAELDVSVTALTQKEVGELQVHAEEQQRVLGVLPNFFVAYDWKAVPLTPKQKFSLVVTTFRDPINIILAAGAAGVQQSQNDFAGYGQGAQGYGKRFGANYGSLIIGTALGGGIFPVLLHQDPRYFYKGTGTVRSRFVYALSSAIICRGDNGKHQFAAASILGDFSAGAVSNAYYPAEDRGSAGVTLENGLIAVGSDAIGNLFQEFIVRKFTPKSRRGVVNATTTQTQQRH